MLSYAEIEPAKKKRTARRASIQEGEFEQVDGYVDHANMCLLKCGEFIECDGPKYTQNSICFLSAPGGTKRLVCFEAPIILESRW